MASREDIFRRHVKFPLRYDEYGQMIFDAEGTLILEVRGWGKFQRYPEAEHIQDSIGRRIVDLMNKDLQKDE